MKKPHEPLAQSRGLLLRAALASPEEAQELWCAWLEGHSLDEDGAAHQRLLPLLHEKLSGHAGDIPQYGLIGGIRRYTWCENQQLFHAAAPVLRALEAQGIPTMILKGAALALRYYQDTSLRCMRDVDILVPPEYLPESLRVLRDLGWTPAQDWREEALAAFAPLRHAHSFSNGHKREVDLHGYLFPVCLEAASQRPFWEGSVECMLGGVRTRALCTSDQLMHVCLHAALTVHEETYDWVLDASTVLACGEEVDWGRLVGLSRDLRISPYIHAQLTKLRGFQPEQVPQKVLDSLAEDRGTAWERREFARHQSPGIACSVRGMAWLHLRDYQRWKARIGPSGEDSGYLRYLQLHWNLRHRRQAPGMLMRRAWKKLAAAASTE